MDILKDRRVILAGGAGLALAAGLAVAALIATRHHDSQEAPPASQGGLVVQTGRDDDIKLDPRRPLRCFVNGLLVGELPLADCAKRNGVATGGLDVGLDPSGALAASHGMSTDITPLPPSPASLASAAAPPADSSPPQADAPPAAPPAVARAGGAPCLRYGEAGWRRLPYDTTLNACVQTLYAGQCVAPGGALYGRWGDRTLRLVPGRVEISGDNRNFHTLAGQGSACSLPPIAPPQGY
ncbi:MAG: hypothetical protein ABI306_07665 [Caulobacteraceae bacterium]